MPAIDQAPVTIYVTAQALATVTAIAGLDECERDALNGKLETRLNQREGYYLSSESMQLAVLPEGADVALTLTPNEPVQFLHHVSFPPELRGVVFSGAPKLPENYAAVLAYWSPLEITEHFDGAQYVQNLLNEYPVPESGGDVLLSNGVVLCIRDVAVLTAGLHPNQFIEIHIPVQADMLGVDRELFDSEQAYDLDPSHAWERLFLRVQDALASPDPDFIAIAALHTENHDAEFYQ